MNTGALNYTGKLNLTRNPHEVTTDPSDYLVFPFLARAAIFPNFYCYLLPFFYKMIYSPD